MFPEVQPGLIAGRFTLHEEKRGKRNEVTINDSIQEALTEYLAAYPAITGNPVMTLT